MTDSNAAKPVHFLPEDLLGRAIHVHLAGVGGTGSQMLTGLARLHVALLALGHPRGLDVTAFDPDTVSRANVGRQLFSPCDVGHSKAVVLIHRLNTWFGTKWTARCQKYTPEFHQTNAAGGGTMSRSCDIVITCVDTAAARRTIGHHLQEMGPSAPRYWLDCGNAQQTGQVFLTDPLAGERVYHGSPMPPQGVELPTLRRMLPELWDTSIPEDDKPSCSLAEALEEQGLYINQHIASWGLTILERLLRTGQTEICGYYISLDGGRVAPVPIPAPAVAPSRARCKVGAKG